MTWVLGLLGGPAGKLVRWGGIALAAVVAVLTAFWKVKAMGRAEEVAHRNAEVLEDVSVVKDIRDRVDGMSETQVRTELKSRWARD